MLNSTQPDTNVTWPFCTVYSPGYEKKKKKKKKKTPSGHMAWGWCRFDVDVTSHRRRYDVILAPYACWELTSVSKLLKLVCKVVSVLFSIVNSPFIQFTSLKWGVKLPRAVRGICSRRLLIHIVIPCSSGCSHVQLVRVRFGGIQQHDPCQPYRRIGMSRVSDCPILNMAGICLAFLYSDLTVVRG